jgi:pimeloyl-ACP methyl ester carboxylesterase
MQARGTRSLPPARVAALVVIVLLGVGLVYVRMGKAPDEVAVPVGAKAGDLKLEPCSYATEDGPADADCGTLVVPENRRDPRSRLIALPVVRIRARSSRPAEPIFRLEGGPGLTNMEFPKASRVSKNHDVVLVGYRGREGSVVLDCPEVESALTHSTDFLSDKTYRAYGDGFRLCASRLKSEGVDLAGYSIPQRVDDLEAARVALKYRRIDLLSESAGTRTAMIYAWRYPKSILRSVMIGANPPGHFFWDGKIIDEQIGRYSALCSKDVACSKRTDDLAQTMRRTSPKIPSRWWLLRIKPGHVRVASFFGLAESTMDAAPIAAPMTLHSWTSAAAGDPSGFWFLSFAGDLIFPKTFVWGDVAAFGRTDANALRDYLARDPAPSILGDSGTMFIWGGGELADAWPAQPDENQYNRVTTSNVETLVVSGTLDLPAPPQAATTELMPFLKKGRQVLLQGFGHTTDFWTYQAGANRQLLNTFFDTGKVDESRYRPSTVDFSPQVTQTALGKGTAGVMGGFALLTILSVVWLMPRRVRKRGCFGRRASATLRSVYPIVLGLGGWFTGLLLVMIVAPGFNLDSQGLAVVAIGAPVGLGVFWAWVFKDDPAHSKRNALVAVMASSFAGSWLGFNAGADLLAIITAIVGATLLSNLVLIVIDVVGARAIVRSLANAPEPMTPGDVTPS